MRPRSAAVARVGASVEIDADERSMIRRQRNAEGDAIPQARGGSLHLDPDHGVRLRCGVL